MPTQKLQIFSLISLLLFSSSTTAQTNFQKSLLDRLSGLAKGIHSHKEAYEYCYSLENPIENQAPDQISFQLLNCAELSKKYQEIEPSIEEFEQHSLKLFKEVEEELAQSESFLQSAKEDINNFFNSNAQYASVFLLATESSTASAGTAIAGGTASGITSTTLSISLPPLVLLVLLTSYINKVNFHFSLSQWNIIDYLEATAWEINKAFQRNFNSAIALSTYVSPLISIDGLLISLTINNATGVAEKIYDDHVNGGENSFIEDFLSNDKNLNFKSLPCILSYKNYLSSNLWHNRNKMNEESVLDTISNKTSIPGIAEMQLHLEFYHAAKKLLSGASMTKTFIKANACLMECMLSSQILNGPTPWPHHFCPIKDY
ncbi:hypothetical protein N9N67_08150 [Bacteriovoracaceae bacterium]|nr:hypothetical protein [Bacteriovoracaceae bacterium]